MVKKRLIILIALASISILVLIVLQTYWVKKSIETQEKQFDQMVMDVMSNVVQKLDREEAVTKITSSLLGGEELFSGLSSDTVLNVQPKKTEKEDNSLTNSLARIPSDYLQSNFKPPPQNDSSYFIIRETKKRILSSSIQDSYSSDTLLKNHLKKKALLFNDIVNEIALITIRKDKNELVSYEKIDSLFLKELMIHGINADYVFDILDAQTNRLTFTEDENGSSELRDSPYKIALFPNAFLLESDELLLYFPEKDSLIIKNSWKVLLISILLIFILIGLFYSSISTIYKQKKLSLVKNDFINNMTHELKTPISTISLACEALIDKTLMLDPERQTSYVSMIKDENKRLSILVDNVLKSAVWDSTHLKLNFLKINLHDIIQKVSQNFDIQINNRNGKLNLDLGAKEACILADKVHFSNVIYNLLDNANKYSPEIPKIGISTRNEEGSVILSISDNGIGISKENQKKIFDKFFRVSTGNIHDIKGFGLGLSYVKRIVDLHHAEISIESTRNKGTTINIKIATHGK
ncbi:HAMP domain-containing histidine kinase [Vicingaceae bacterium]|nr:HAMP domain-containing histidine kinase [Vicingaceae bacterium]